MTRAITFTDNNDHHHHHYYLPFAYDSFFRRLRLFDCRWWWSSDRGNFSAYFFSSSFRKKATSLSCFALLFLLEIKAWMANIHTTSQALFFIFYASPLWWWWPLCCNDIIWPFTSSTSKVEVEHITGQCLGWWNGEKDDCNLFFFEYDNDGMYLWPWCLPYGHIVIWFIHSLIWWPGEREKFSFIYPHTEEAWFSHGFSFFFLNSLLSLWSNVKEFIFFFWAKV